MKYIAPAYLLVVLGGFTYYNLGEKATEVSKDPIALWTVMIIAAVIALLVVLVAIGERRWRAAGMDLDGKGVGGRVRTMNTGGWIFMLLSLGLVWGTTIWAYCRLLGAPPEKPDE